jgi:hypothetical protein
MASDWNIGVTSRVKAMVLATTRAKTIRNVSFLAQTILPTTLNDMQVSLLVGFRQVRRQKYGKCEIARWFHFDKVSAADLRKRLEPLVRENAALLEEDRPQGHLGRAEASGRDRVPCEVGGG